MDWLQIINIIAMLATIIGAIATIISTVIAVRAKNKSKDILRQIKEQNRNVKNYGDIKVKNSGDNFGVMSGIIEDIELGIDCFTCFCFIECKILEKPI